MGAELWAKQHAFYILFLNQFLSSVTAVLVEPFLNLKMLKNIIWVQTAFYLGDERVLNNPNQDCIHPTLIRKS